MLMALNMGPSCTYDEALRNLYGHTAQVFDTILRGESRTILKRVKHVRQAAIFPRIRAKYQLVGELFAEMLQAALAKKVPELADHMWRQAVLVD